MTLTTYKQIISRDMCTTHKYKQLKAQNKKAINRP